MKHILIIDDDMAICISLSLLLEQHGYLSTEIQRPELALELMRNQEFDLVIQDMNFSSSTTGEEGKQLLKEIRAEFSDIPIILITAWGSIELAVDGIKLGANDFVTKPWSSEQLLTQISTQIALQKQHTPVAQKSRTIITEDPVMIQRMEQAIRVGPTEAQVLIQGQKGTGKEVFAELIHINSNRCDRPLIDVQMDSINQENFDDELLGYYIENSQGEESFIPGKLLQANGGTLFLEEIGKLDLISQFKLLKILQDQQFEINADTFQFDVRVLSSTSENLRLKVGEGLFREDLLYRINLIELELPPLNSRIGDIQLLAHHFLELVVANFKLKPLMISAGAMDWLSSQSWPGNVRQIKHHIHQAALLASSEILEKSDLLQVDHSSNDQPTIDSMEKELIQSRLNQLSGNISQVASSLGLSRAALYRRIEKHEINV